uniref:Uncharacterized protein n=1 Tax=Anguilla anguilla TaxID=7936 RepID=A0A0E9WN22_ANGAN
MSSSSNSLYKARLTFPSGMCASNEHGTGEKWMLNNAIEGQITWQWGDHLSAALLVKNSHTFYPLRTEKHTFGSQK